MPTRRIRDTGQTGSQNGEIRGKLRPTDEDARMMERERKKPESPCGEREPQSP